MFKHRGVSRVHVTWCSHLKPASLCHSLENCCSHILIHTPLKALFTHLHEHEHCKAKTKWLGWPKRHAKRENIRWKHQWHHYGFCQPAHKASVSSLWWISSHAMGRAAPKVMHYSDVPLLQPHCFFSYNFWYNRVISICFVSLQSVQNYASIDIKHEEK